MLHKAKSRLFTKSDESFSERQQRIYTFLKSNAVAVLSSVNPDGEPHGVVVYYVIDKQFNVYFLTRSGTQKYDNLIHNNRVMLTVFEPFTQTTVQMNGHASEITDSSEVNAIAGAVLGASFGTNEAGLQPITKLQAGAYVAFRIEPVQIRMAVYARPDAGDYEDIFESIESFEMPE